MKTITGNTYPVKEKLKSLGARWNSALKGWDIEDKYAAEAEALVQSAGPSTWAPRRVSTGRARYQSNYVRFSSGAEMYQNKRGRCIDAPCCGCCS